MYNDKQSNRHLINEKIVQYLSQGKIIDILADEFQPRILTARPKVSSKNIIPVHTYHPDHAYYQYYANKCLAKDCTCHEK